MPLQSGARLGPYEILAPIGAGGMGEVYRARDTRLDRTVAIKVLPEALAADPQFRERFDREARAISQLTHPHICTLYDVGEAVVESSSLQLPTSRLRSPEDAASYGVARQSAASAAAASLRFLVMELLEGETLEQRLKKGALPLEQSLRTAIEIASALDKAHRAGITHRDLKPGNIMLTKTGAKLLDFGLAKTGAGGAGMAGGPGGAAGLSMLPTTPPNLTAHGTILGTFQYMAPEQLEGQEADPRTDLFAFGAVLYEMLTGKKAFEGKSQASLIGAILEREPPPISTEQPLSPAALDRVVRKCLAKDPDARWQSARDLHDELAWIAAEGATASSGTRIAVIPATPTKNSRLAWIVAAAAATIAVLLAVPAVRHLRGAPAPSLPEMRLQIALPPGASLTSFALSPDGRTLVFSSEGKLWQRLLDSEVAQPLAGTEGTGALLPFWSPDSQSVGFFADSKLKRVDLLSGVVRIVADLPGASGRGGTWNVAGTIVFAPSSDGSPLYRVSADGGEAAPVTRLEPGHRTQRYPQFLPDGHHFIFFARTTDGQGIYLGSIDSLETRRVQDSDGSAVFAPPDTVLFARKGALLAQRFDLNDMMPLGNPTSVAGHVAVDWVTPNTSVAGSLAISASTTGLLAYRPSAGLTQFLRLDRQGREIGRVGDAHEGQLTNAAALSPDRGTLAIGRTVGGNTDIWLFDLKQSLLPRRFTTGPAWDGPGAWSPDGKQIVFASSRKGVLDLYIKSVDGNDEQPLLESANGKLGNDWSSDGRFLLFQDAGPKTADDLWALPLFGDRKPFVVVQTPALECCGRFSPDGRWISFDSYETGRKEVYVQSFPGAAGRLRISTNGGQSSAWRSDGREVFYHEPSGQVMAVPVTMEGTTLRPGMPVALFRVSGPVIPMRDGQSFLTLSVIEEPSPITLLLNWKRPAE